MRAFEVDASCTVQNNQVQRCNLTLPPELTGNQTTTLAFTGQLNATSTTKIAGPNGTFEL